MPNIFRKNKGANKVVESKQEKKLVSFDQNNRKQVQQIYETTKFLKDEIKHLQSDPECSKLNLVFVEIENAKLKQALTLNKFQA